MRRYSNLYVKRRLVKLEIDIIGIISQGLTNRASKRMILLDVKKEISRVSKDVGLDSREISDLWNNAFLMYDEIFRKTAIKISRAVHSDHPDKEKTELKNQILYAEVRKKLMSDALIKESNAVMYNYEQRKKHDEILGTDGLIASADSPFFLASKHPKPAKDHENWEGKMYYDENWEEKFDYSEEDRGRIRAYIKNHKLNTIQFVTGPGIWLCLRRNCKHFLKNIPAEEVLHSSVRKMLKKHGMIHKETVPASNEILRYRANYNRLKELEEVKKIIPNKILDEDIKRTQRVLNKWRNAL